MRERNGPPSGTAQTWVDLTQSSNPDPCEAEEEHHVPPLQVNLTHVTPPGGKGAQFLFLEPQTACKQLKGGCCEKLRRGGDHLKSLPQLPPPLALKICGLRTIKTPYAVGKVITSGSSCTSPQTWVSENW